MVRLSPAEHEDLKRAASAAGLSISGALREGAAAWILAQCDRIRNRDSGETAYTFESDEEGP